jgi:hypothetical protein
MYCRGHKAGSGFNSVGLSKSLAASSLSSTHRDKLIAVNSSLKPMHGPKNPSLYCWYPQRMSRRNFRGMVMTNSHKNTLSTSIALSQHLVIQVLRMPFECRCSPNPKRRHFHVSFPFNDGISQVLQVEEHVLLPQLAFVSVFEF